MLLQKYKISLKINYLRFLKTLMYFSPSSLKNVDYQEINKYFFLFQLRSKSINFSQQCQNHVLSIKNKASNTPKKQIILEKIPLVQKSVS